MRRVALLIRWPLPKLSGPRQLGYDSDYDRLGLKGSFNTIGPSFASASASPLSHYKFYAGEGGMRVYDISDPTTAG